MATCSSSVRHSVVYGEQLWLHVSASVTHSVAFRERMWLQVSATVSHSVTYGERQWFMFRFVFIIRSLYVATVATYFVQC